MSEEAKEVIEYFKEKIKNKLPLYIETYIDGKPYRRNILQLETNFTEEQANKTEILLNLIEKQQKEIEELQIIADDIKGHNIVYTDTPEFEDNFISKDKIREKMEEVKNLSTAGYEILKELLEEN